MTEVTPKALKEHRKLSGRIRLETGLHIGTSAEMIEIGGMDNPIIRNPIDDFPYIPGSSLKGKMRSLLEWAEGTFTQTKDGYGPCKCAREDCLICKVFGVAGSEDNKLGPTRVLVRDAFLTEESRRTLQQLRREKGLLFAEEKYENQIDRLKGTAKHPRSIERVPPGIEFEFEIVLRVFEGDDVAEMVNLIKKGFTLIEHDALGGLGSRGSGKVKFILDDQSLEGNKKQGVVAS